MNCDMGDVLGSWYSWSNSNEQGSRDGFIRRFKGKCLNFVFKAWKKFSFNSLKIVEGCIEVS